MTDERDLHELAAPLLADPPHPPPPLDELRARVDRRRQRRARAIGATSVLAVVLVAAAVLALPRDRELQVGNGTSAPTTQAPPPIEAAPIQLVVTPESAPATTERTIEIRNTSAEDYTTCGTYDLFRWDGETWTPALRVYLGGGGTMFGRYDLSEHTDECSWSPIAIAAGETTSLGFDPDTSVLWAVTATALPGTAPLTDGWYELREPPDGVAESSRPLGRFEITPPGSDPAENDPPPVATAPIQLVVSPESAPIDAERTLEIRNTSDLPYDECGFAYGLHRWNGSSWVPVALVWASGDHIERSDNPETPRIIDCAAADPVPAGTSRTFPFHPNAARWDPMDGTTPPRTDALGPGRYELRPHRGAQSELAAVGRFEIIGSTPTVPPPPGDAPTTGTAVVDLYPLDGLEPAGEKLPAQIVLPDDNTVSIGWQGWCNEPADHVTVTATEDEIELRLSVGTFPVIDCVGESQHWAATFTLPMRIRGRAVVARADGADGELAADPVELPGAWSPEPPGEAVDVAVLVSVGSAADNRTVTFRPAYPIVSEGASTCSSGSTTITTSAGPVRMPRMQADPTGGTSVGFFPCRESDFTMPLDPDVAVIGEP